jgi:hypothetical protein
VPALGLGTAALAAKKTATASAPEEVTVPEFVSAAAGSRLAAA